MCLIHVVYYCLKISFKSQWKFLDYNWKNIQANRGIEACKINHKELQIIILLFLYLEDKQPVNTMNRSDNFLMK